MSPPDGPVDIAVARRLADRKELDGAKLSGDWGRAIDVVHANIHEVEHLTMRSLSKHEVTHTELSALRVEVSAMSGLLGTVLGSVGELVLAIERAPKHEPAPSYRPSLSSASNLDAQALAQTIENVHTELQNNQIAIVGRVVALEMTIGAPPDELKGTKGSGIAAIVHKLNSKRTLVALALLAALASALGTNIAELAKWIFHALKG